MIGKILFGQDAFVYLSLALVAGIWWFIYRTRWGLVLRAVGDNHASAHALGYPVLTIRTFAVLFGGACAGLAGEDDRDGDSGGDEYNGHDGRDQNLLLVVINARGGGSLAGLCKRND